MPRLALFLPELTAGGAQQALLTLCPHFVEATGPVDLLLACAEGPLLDRVPHGVRVIDLSAGRRRRSRIELGLRATWGLVRYLREHGPETLLSTLTGANCVAVIARRASQTPVRLVLREANTPDNLHSRFTAFAVRRLYPNADALIAVSDATRTGLIKKALIRASQVHTISNPVDARWITLEADKPPNHTWFAAGSAPVIVTVGRLVPQKDHHTLIEAFARLRRHHEARLLILGEGPLRQSLVDQIRSRGLDGDVDLPGFVANPYPLMRRASLFVLSSLWEGMPNALLEALALDVPTVATECSNPPRDLLDGVNPPRLAPPRDPDALARLMQQALTRGVPERRLPSNALARYSPDSTAQAYLRVLFTRPGPSLDHSHTY